MHRHGHVAGRSGISCAGDVSGTQQPGQPFERNVQLVFSGVPEQVGMVQQRGQLVDPLTQALFGPKLSEQGDYLAQHQESVSVAGIVAGLGEGTANPGEHPLGNFSKNEIEWAAAHG
jgi:hypothetical protein